MHQHCLTSVTLTWLRCGWVFDFYCKKHWGFFTKFLNNLGLTFLNYLTARNPLDCCPLLERGIPVCAKTVLTQSMQERVTGLCTQAGTHSCPHPHPSSRVAPASSSLEAEVLIKEDAIPCSFHPCEWWQSCKHTAFPHKSRMGFLQWLCQGVTALGSTRLGRRHRLTFTGFNIPTNYFSTQAA